MSNKTLKKKEKWAADSVSRVPVAKLTPYARNTRTHTDAQIAQVAASIKEWGWTNPVLISEDHSIIAGHARVLAAEKLGLEDVPCAVASGWSEAQIKAYVIADNKLALNAGWDFDMLAVEIEDLKDLSFDVEMTGFTEGEIDKLLDFTSTEMVNETSDDERQANATCVIGAIRFTMERVDYDRFMESLRSQGLFSTDEMAGEVSRRLLNDLD